jgi:hypothetical protein
MTTLTNKEAIEVLKRLRAPLGPHFKEIIDAYNQAIKALEGPEAWPIATDGPHKIEGTRLWLARQLVDSKHDEATALSIVAHHPAIAAAPPAPKVAP